ncbi:MAG: PEGA domain-containing protein [Myxococcales bacterium]|nr:PEGA domain-containing protein [Myxococcales bacterium]
MLQPAAPVVPPRPVIGASIQAQAPRRNSLARVALVVLCAIAAMLAVYQFVLRKKPAVAVPAPSPIASIKFIVQPEDSIVEIGGKEAGRLSPFEAPLEPGVYSIAVRRAGYKQWTSQVTLRDGEKQTVRVALEAGVARLSITSQPAGLVAHLDGKQLEQLTPLEVQTTAGAHTLVVTNAAGIPWSQEFTAEIDGKYTFHAPLTATKKPAAATPNVTPTRPTPTPPPDRIDRIDRTNDRIKRPPPSTPAVVIDTEPRVPDRIPEPPPMRPDAGVPLPVTPKQPEIKPAVPRSSAPALIAQTAVTKISGSIPTLKVTSNDDSADVIGKICIDESGHVTSVKAIVKSLPEISEEIQRSLMAWRYRPYTNPSGQSSAACFPYQLRVVFKRGN